MRPLKKKAYAVAVCKKGYYLDDLNRKKFHVIKNGLTYWVGDPFPIEVEGDLYIFGEIYEYATRKGRIGYTKLENGKFTPWKVVIKEQYHLSFPNVFYIDNDLFMCPEANESGEIYLYKCIDFPNKWVKDKTLYRNGKFCDTVFVEKNGDIFGLTFKLKKMNVGTFELFKIEDGRLVFADGHKKLMENVYARPAGKAFIDTKYSRTVVPFQIGEPTYVSGMVLKEVDVCWPDYEEREIYRVYPQQLLLDKKRKYIGTHTLNMTDNYLVVDVIWNRFNIVEMLCRARLFVKRRIARTKK